MYVAMRILDTSQPQHGGNVETRGGYTTDLDEVQKIVDAVRAGIRVQVDYYDPDIDEDPHVVRAAW